MSANIDVSCRNSTRAFRIPQLAPHPDANSDLTVGQRSVDRQWFETQAAARIDHPGLFWGIDFRTNDDG
jgi:hypothetical protein